MLDLLAKASCSLEEKRSLLELVRYLLELSEKARRDGLLKLETSDESLPFFFRKAMELIAEGMDPNYTRSILNNYIVSGNYTGRELLKRILILEAALSIQAGEHPRILGERLASLLGEELYPEAEFSLLQRYQPEASIVDEFIQTILHQTCLSEQTSIIETPFNDLSNSALQKVIREVPLQILESALKGASGTTIERVLSNSSRKRRIDISINLKSKGPLTEKEIITSQNDIIGIIHRMKDLGEL